MLIRMGMGGQLSGSVAGVVASHNRGGQYLRNRSIPVNPNTVRQTEVRSAFASASFFWRTLTDAQRGGWISYAAGTPRLNRLGESITLSGHMWYAAVNGFLGSAGQPGTATAPPSPGLSTLGASQAVTASAATQELTLATIGATAFDVIAFQMGPALSAGVGFAGGPVTFVGADTTGDASGGSVVIAVNRYGILVAGQRRVVRVMGIDGDGRLSDVFRQIVSVGA